MLKTYSIQTNCCDLYYEDGTSQRIYYYADSGKTLKRKKTHPIYKNIIEKKAVIIGKLYDETIMVLHNQLTLNKAEIITYKNFTQNEECLPENKIGIRDVYTFLHKALPVVIKNMPFTPLEINCLNDIINSEKNN